MSRPLSILNPNPQRLPGPDNLHHLVATESNDGRPAIEYASPDGEVESLTYQQLHESADSLARLLRSKLKADPKAHQHQLIVPICIQQCPLLYTAELAILKAGAAFCPLPLDVPEERLRFILNDVQATVLLTTAELQHRIPVLDSVSIVIADTFDSDAHHEPLPERFDPASSAYVMYTSGSTGQPKGVILSHSAATQALLAHERHIPQFSRFLQFANPTFDVSIFEIFFPLSRGQTLVCGERRQLLNDLPGFIKAMRIDAAELTPSVASSLLRGRGETPSLKLLLTIGEMLKQDVIDEYGGSTKERSILYGMYGPTEATIHCTLQSTFTNDMPPGNIGIPLDTVSAFVVKPASEDKSQVEEIEILPIGEEGELAVGGYQVADGYLNRPGQNRKVFIPHPEFGGLYRTGDRAKLTKDGVLECSGRISSGQVKLRGQRIELGEIEYAASRTPGCRTVVAEIVSGSLVVFCVVNSTDIDETNIRDTCRKWLPAFMVPADVVLLDSLPYMDSGKVDRKALRGLYMSTKAQINGETEEWDYQLQSLTKIISEVLNVGLNSDTPLLAAGMDSLSSIRISSQLKRAGFRQLDATVVLESRTVREIDAELRRTDPAHGESLHKSTDLARKLHTYPILAGVHHDIDHIYAATTVQSSMLFETARRNVAYCNWTEFEISDLYSQADLSASIQQLANVHGLLRSGFFAVEGFQANHAVVAWNSLDPSQIRFVREFDYKYELFNDKDLLRPCNFQIKRCKEAMCILLQIHHAQYDQWSLDVLRIDLHNILRGQKSCSRPSYEAVSNFHYAQPSTSHDDNLEFWYDLLHDFTATPLPSLVNRKVPAALIRTMLHPLDCDLSLIRDKARELRCSVPAIFQSAMVYLLGSYVGSSEVTLGLVLSGRHIPLDGIEGVFGPCLSTLPLRIDYSTVRTSAELVRLVQSRNRAMQKHSMTPLAAIKRLVKDLGATQLFDTLFVWQESTLKFDQTEVSVREIDCADQHEYNLVLEFEPVDNSIRIRATFQQALLSSAQVKHLMAQIQHYVNCIVNRPDERIEHMNDGLSESLLSIVNPEPKECAAGYNFVQAIETHAQATPSAQAIIFANTIESSPSYAQTTSYKELNNRSNQLARFIRSQHSISSNLVCIYMAKGVDLYVAILAAVKAGFGYLPIVPDTPPLRVDSIIQQANVSFCICDTKTSRNLRDNTHVHTVDVTELDLCLFGTGNLDIEFPAERVAYIVFTSGSTGEPKGVPVTMKNLVGNIQALSEIYPSTSGDRLLQACSHAFDVSVFEIFFTFYNGLCLCSAPNESLFEDLEASVRHLGITHLSLTPTVAGLVEPAAVPSVKFLVTAGEAVTEAVHARWAGNGLHQGYGPSETTNICSVNMNVSLDDLLGSIGPPLRNTSAFVLQPGSKFRILPTGALGELAFGGEQVFPGYLCKDELNEAKIVPHPRYGRVYKSGDLGRILPDGSMLIQGRLDNQVKIRGNRVELGEICAILQRSDQVGNCATLTMGQEAASQAIASFIVPTAASSTPVENGTSNSFGDINFAHLFDLLDEALPLYMVPSTITVVRDMPRTSQGKLDQVALRKLLAIQHSPSAKTNSRENKYAEGDENLSADEIQIADLLSRNLGIESKYVTRQASLFSLGLNSLNAISFAKQLSRATETKLNISTVLRNPSIAKLGRIIKEGRNAAATNSHPEEANALPTHLTAHVQRLSSFQEHDIERVLPCTPLQEAMLSASAGAATNAYWNTLSMKVYGDVQKLKRCWQYMMDRHGILRTRFISTNDRTHPFVQIVLKSAQLPWIERNSSHALNNQSFTPTDTPEQSFANRSPFNIECVHYRDERELILSVHHAIYDGISLCTLLKEVEQHYNALALHPTGSFVAFLREVAKHSEQNAMDFWASELQGFMPQPLPRASEGKHPRASVLRKIMLFGPTELDSWCKRHSLSQLSIFQTALVKTLAASSNSRDICFGNIVSGRSVPIDDIENLIAPCFNTVPVRIKLYDNDSNVELASRLNKKNIEALRYQLAPLRRVQSLSISPSKHLFDCLLIVQPRQQSLDSNIWAVQHETGDMDLPLVFELVPIQKNWELILHYSERYVPQATASSLWKAFSASVSSCLSYAFGGHDSLDDQELGQIAGLLASDCDMPRFTNGITAPTLSQLSDEENMICEVFAQLAGVSRKAITASTSMFQLGLDSLNAPQVAAQLRSAGLEVDAGDVLECLTPATIAQRGLSKSLNSPRRRIDLQKFDRKHRPQILKRSRASNGAIDSVWPCTPVQSGMLLQSFQSNGGLYVNHIAYRVPRAISTDALRTTWKKLTAKYQVLRMGFHKIDDLKTPFVLSILSRDLTSVPLIECSEEFSVSDVESRAKKAIMRSLSRQAWCVQLTSQNEDQLMVLSLHHALYDANSLNTILDDFASALVSHEIGSSESIEGALTANLEAAMDHSNEGTKFWSTKLQNSMASKFPDLTPTLMAGNKLQYEDYNLTVCQSTIEEFCKSQGATGQALGQTIWGILLASYIGDDKVTFGTVFSGHSNARPAKAMFPSIATIPVPCEVAGSSLEVLHNMVKFNAAAHRHRYKPLDEIKGLAGNDYGALFDTIFVYQKEAATKKSFDWEIVAETAAVDYVASLELSIGRKKFAALRLTFRTDRIPSSQARLILRQYEHLLHSTISGQKTQPKSLYSILPPKQPEIPAEAPLLHQMVEYSASQHPDRIALTFVYTSADNTASPKSWTYRQLDDRGNQVAHLLRRHQISPGDVVAVCMGKSSETSFAFLGILKAGCSFLAIDPALPEARLQFILKDSGAKLLFFNEETTRDPTEQAVNSVKLSTSMLDSFSKAPHTRSEIIPGSTCYCLYTSGTTGTPKGCEITHENAVQAMMAFRRLFAGRWTKKSRWLQFASYWFDVAVLEQFWSWSVGIEVISAPRDVVLEDLPGFISKYKITHIDLTPSLARLLEPEDVPSLWDGVFITGGEALKQEIIDSWGPNKTICNGYGPTEATIGVTMNTFIGQDAKPANIGRQFDNVGAFVLRPQSDEPVLRGAVGELCVSGKLVGKGYLNRSELTATQFPILERFGKIYRTGDLVRVLADGSFSFIGRKDTQTKLRGQRLETSEVDSVILSCNDVAHAMSLIVKAGPASRETLVSFLTKNARSETQELSIDVSEDALQLTNATRQACASRLPGYMIPTHVIPINFLPLTVNNKVDTKRLIHLFESLSPRDLQMPSGLSSDGSSMTASEYRIRKSLCDLLSIEPQGILPHSNLFSIGLTSISAILFSSLLKRKGFKRANVAAVMANPTIRQLAATVDESTDESRENEYSVEQAKLSIAAFSQRYYGAAVRALSISRDDIEAVVPCTPLQQGLISESLRLDHAPYFNDFCYVLNNLDIAIFCTAIQELCRRTSILRARFFDTDQGTSQVVMKNPIVPITNCKVPKNVTSTSYFRDLKSKWIELNRDGLMQPFEVHIVCADDQWILKLHIHHVLYDGISFDMMINHLCRLYNGDSTKDSGPDFVSALPYGPLRQLKSAKMFWQKRLENRSQKVLPSLHSTGKAGHSSSSSSVETTLLETIRKQLGVSHQAIIQSCFEVALRKCAPSVYIYGVVVSGRSIELLEADQVVGPMFNTLPQPLQRNVESTLKQYVQTRHDENIATIPYQHTSLRDIRKWTGWKSNDSIFDVLFVFQHTSESTKSAIGRLMHEVEQSPQAHYPLSCEIEFSDNGSMNILVLAQSRYFSQEQVQCIVDGIEEALESILRDAEAPLARRFSIEIESATPAEQGDFLSGHELNGVHEFEWTRSALTIRTEIAALLRLDETDVDEHSTIFSLGLDSIDAVKLASRLRKVGLLIPVSKILQGQTIPKILHAMQYEESKSISNHAVMKLSEAKKQLDGIAQSLSSVTAEEMEAILPATPAQEALLADMYRTDLQEYFNHDVLRLRPETDLDRLKLAWQTVVEHSPILRTIFVDVSYPDTDVVFAQIVLAKVRHLFEEQECADEKDIEEIFDSIRINVLENKHNQPPFRLTVVQVRQEHYLILSLAHAQYDGHSLALLHDDVGREYAGIFAERPSHEFAIEAALTAVNDQAIRFWTDHLSGIVIHRFPRIGSDGEGCQTFRAERTTEIRSTSAREFCKANEISMQALAQTCWALTLAHYTRRMEVAFGVVLACRDSKVAEEVMFPTMNTVVMRTSLHGSRAQMVHNVQSLGIEILPYQRTPLRVIRAAISSTIITTEESPKNGMFDTLFIYQHKPAPQDDLGTPLYDSVGGNSEVEYPVAVEMEASDGESVVIRAACRSSVLDEMGTEQLLEAMEEILHAIINAPDEPAVEFDGHEISICGMDSFYLEEFRDNKNEIESAAEDKIEADTSPTTLAIVKVFAQISKVALADIKPSTTIENIGIDSISAIKVAAMLRNQDIHLSVSEILRAKTAARMAEELKTKQSPEPKAKHASKDTISAAVKSFMEQNVLRYSGIEPSAVETVMPATAGQVYMLSMWQKTSGQLFYPTFKYQLTIDWEIETIYHAWKTLRDHHPILRTTFVATEVIHMPALQVVLRKDAASNPSRAMASLKADKTDAGFRLSLDIHHALYDAVSLPILMHDFKLLFAGRPVPRSKLDFEDFIAPSVTHRAKQFRKHFWSDYLDNIDSLTLHRPLQDGPQRKVEIFRPSLFAGVHRVEKMSRKQNLSLPSILFATYAKIYASLASGPSSEEKDIVLGVYLSNRSHLSDLETLAAPTVNLVPLLVRSPQLHSLLEIARRVQEDLQKIGSVGNSAVGLWEIEQWTGVKVDTFINLLKLPEQDGGPGGDLGGVTIKPLNGERLQECSHVVDPTASNGFEVPKELEGMGGIGAHQHSLDIEMTVTDGKLDVGLFCPASMISLQEAEDALAEFKALLEKFVGKAKA